MRKPLNKTKIFAIASLMLLIALTIPITNAQTATITVDSEPINPDDSATVEGEDFAATSDVNIWFGEVTVYDEFHEITDVNVGGPTVFGPFTATALHYPIKPGSFSFFCNVSAVTSEYWDEYGNGTLSTSSTYAIDPFVNYVTGEFGRSSSANWSTYIVSFSATYTYYEYDVTPTAGVTTDGTGAFTAEITVPDVYGNCSVFVADDEGNFALSTETVEVIPEGLTFGVMILLSSVALLVGSRYLWKRSRKR